MKAVNNWICAYGYYYAQFCKSCIEKVHPISTQAITSPTYQRNSESRQHSQPQHSQYQQQRSSPPHYRNIVNLNRASNAPRRWTSDGKPICANCGIIRHHTKCCRSYQIQAIQTAAPRTLANGHISSPPESNLTICSLEYICASGVSYTGPRMNVVYSIAPYRPLSTSALQSMPSLPRSLQTFLSSS